VVTDYLERARQRLLLAGDFRIAQDAPPGLEEWLLEREEPGEITLVALLPSALGDEHLKGVRDSLAVLAGRRAQVGEKRTLVVLLAAVDEPISPDQQPERWQILVVQADQVLVVPWVADLRRGLIAVHDGADPVLAELVAPSPPASALSPGRTPGEAAPGLSFPWVTAVLAGGIVVIWLTMTITGGSLDATESDVQLLARWGAAVHPDMWREGQMWRLLTANFLHIGLMHLALNTWNLWVLGRTVERLLGPWRLLYLFLVAGIAGNIASAVFGHPLMLSAGASAGLFGLLGSLIWFRLTSPLGSRIAWTPLLMTVAINLGFGLGLSHMVDNWGHAGGLVGGFIAAAAAGVPAVAGLAAPRFKLRPSRQAGVALLLLAVMGAVVAGAVELPGPGRDLARAEQAIDAGHPAEAEPLLLRAVSRQPDEPYLRYLLAAAYILQGKCEQASVERVRLMGQSPEFGGNQQLEQLYKRCLKQ